jgi:hypothetical protein
LPNEHNKAVGQSDAAGELPSGLIVKFGLKRTLVRKGKERSGGENGSGTDPSR